MLPEPFVPRVAVEEDALLEAWRALATSDVRLWVVIGLARFAGMRREEISAARVGWIEVTGGVVSVAMRDRPEENWWTKTGRPYIARVIDPELAGWLLRLREQPPSTLLVDDPPEDRRRWFERVPQGWLKAHGITAAKPLHRLRGLYADHVAKISSDAMAAHLAGVKAAQENLGHTTSATTEKHYLT